MDELVNGIKFPIVWQFTSDPLSIAGGVQGRSVFAGKTHGIDKLHTTATNLLERLTELGK